MTDPPELGELVPGLTRSTISDDERTALYHAAMQGHQLPLGVKHWRRVTRYGVAHPGSRVARITLPSAPTIGLACPGCGHQVPPHDAGPLPCDGCAGVYLVAPETT